MSSYESTLLSASKFVSIAIVTCVLATGGMWLYQQPKMKEPSTLFSPVHWMFWVAGKDFDQELRNPKPVFDFHPVVPAWDSGQISDFARYMEEEQEKRDRLMEDIRSRWGPF